MGDLLPDSPEVADAAGGLRSVYVHLPFCRRRCPYCDFAVVALDEGAPDVSGYTAAVYAELDMTEPWGAIDAVNFGGGTPSATPPNQLAGLLEGIRLRFGLANDAEVSLEVNPEDVAAQRVEQWRQMGFNRVSLGVQSFDDAVLAALGRTHTADEAVDAVRIALAGGIRSVSLDLIYGAPVESHRSWQRTVATALDLGTPHLSAYALTVESGTALSRAVAAGAPSPDDDDQADRFELLDAAASQSGLTRYEVSNFAAPGHVARYNLSTWAHGEYEAVGLGAHGFRGGVRYRNVRRLDPYRAAIAKGQRPRAGSERVVGPAAEAERLMLGVRRTAGVTVGESSKALEAGSDLQRLVDAGVVEVADGRLRVLDPLLTDEVCRAVLAVADQ